MTFIAVLVVCYSLDHCELRHPPGDDLTWPTIEQCEDFGSRMQASALETLGASATHISWWCIRVPKDEQPSESAGAEQPI